jgi:DNA-binding SARP family transcriptional activator
MFVDGSSVHLGPRKQRTVLALLAVNHSQLVGMDAIVDELWPEEPPPSAVPNVRGYAGNLRRLFDAHEPDNARIIRQGDGYTLTGCEGVLDLVAFQADGAAGHRAFHRGDLPEAAACYANALGRWRGTMLAGEARGTRLGGDCAAMEEERLLVVERLAESRIGLGQPDQALPLLRRLVQEAPLRERAWFLLVRARDQAGDVAGALSAYRAARKTLATELGIEPGAELTDLHREILAREGPSGAAPATRAVSGDSGPPRELPPGVGQFVGRGHELEIALDTIAQPRPSTGSRAAVVIFHGPGGTGKSTTAVRVAHQIGRMYPDGHLYVDLLGSTPGLRPLTLMDAVRRLLLGLGLNDVDVPNRLADAVGRLRSLTAGRRHLLLLDNVSEADQIRDLLPASGASAVLVTSRHPLPSLDADRRIRIGGLSAADAVVLLTRLTPEIELDADLADRVADLCDCIPLALRLAAARLAGRPDQTPKEFVAHLADRRRRLDELEVDGLAVRSCIGVSYESLASNPSPASQLATRAFRALGLLNVPDFAPDVVAAMLSQGDRAELRAAFDHLVGAGLVEPLSAGRYRLHDLVRLVAIERAEQDGTGVREAVLGRGLAYYAGAVRRVDQVLRPGRLRPTPDPPMPPNLALPDLDTVQAARHWLAAELPCLVAAVEQACGLPGPVRRMAMFIGDPLWDLLYRRYDWQTARRLSQLMLEAGEAAADPEMLAWGNVAAGRGASDFAEWDMARRRFNRALSLYRAEGNPTGVALALNSLGYSASLQGDLASAARYLADFLTHARANGTAQQEALALNNLGAVLATTKDWSTARSALDESLRIRRQLGDDPALVVSTLTNLATVHAVLGEGERALDFANESVDMTRRLGDHVTEHLALLTRCEVHFRAHRVAEAMSDAEAALALGRERRDRYTEGLALQQQAKIWRSTGETARATRAQAEADRVLAVLQMRRDPLLDVFLMDVPTGAEPAPERRKAVSEYDARNPK